MTTQNTDSTFVASSSTPPSDVSNDTFSNLGIAPQILKSLDYYGFTIPTPIQRDAIPVAAVGTDVIGIAQTGTGKTMAFGIPVVQQLMLQGGHALIVLPTRELAIQVEESLIKIARPLHLSTAVLIGGEAIFRQTRLLQRGVDIVIATPGRLNDHLAQGNLKLDKTRIVVLDEADRMLDMGFAPQIARIMDQVPSERQTMLFSATMPDEILKMTAKYQKNPVRIEVARAGTANEMIEQELIVVPRPGKIDVLKTLLEKYEGSVLVFTRTKHAARQLTASLRDKDYKAMEIHSNRSLGQRKQALEAFKAGRARILVATDIAARGIDVTGIELVVNFDLPDNAEDYVHRIGRTGRAGAMGRAISFATPDQGKEVRAIERLIKTDLPVSDLSAGHLAVIEVPGRSSRNSRPQFERQQSNPRERQPQGQNQGQRRDGFTNRERPNNRPPQNDRPYNRDNRERRENTGEARPSRDGSSQFGADSKISAPIGFVTGKKPQRRPMPKRK